MVAASAAGLYAAVCGEGRPLLAWMIRKGGKAPNCCVVPNRGHHECHQAAKKKVAPGSTSHDTGTGEVILLG